MWKMRMIIVSLTVAGTLGMMSSPVLGETPFAEMGVIQPKIRVEAPAFTLTSLDGEERSLDEFKGKVILLNFWATWCAPCRDEIPAMEALWRRFKKKEFAIIAVAGDRGNMHRVGEFCRMSDVTFTVLLYPKGVVRRSYEVTALPTTYLIGRDGRIVGKILGAREWHSDDSIKLVEHLLEP